MFYLYEKKICSIYVKRIILIEHMAFLPEEVGHTSSHKGVKYQRNAIISPERSRKSKVSDFRQPFLGSAKVSCVV